MKLLNEATGLTVWKFPLDPKEMSALGEFQVEMPEDHKILRVGAQEGTPCVWAEVNPYSAKVKYTFFIVGTGREIFRPEPGWEIEYVGGWDAPPFHWHLYRLVPEEGTED